MPPRPADRHPGARRPGRPHPPPSRSAAFACCSERSGIACDTGANARRSPRRSPRTRRTMDAPDFTLTAGPTMASPRVLAALGSPIVFDYDPLFLERFRHAESCLAEVFRTRHDVVLMQGEAVL